MSYFDATRAVVHYDIFRDHYLLQIGDAPKDGEIAIPRVEVCLSKHAALRLLESLCATGLEAANRSDADRSEQRRHLEDMRAIAFAKLEVPKP